MREPLILLMRDTDGRSAESARAERGSRPALLRLVGRGGPNQAAGGDDTGSAGGVELGPGASSGGVLIRALRDPEQRPAIVANIRWRDVRVPKLGLIVRTPADALRCLVNGKWLRMPISYAEQIEACNLLELISPSTEIVDAIRAAALPILNFGLNVKPGDLNYDAHLDLVKHYVTDVLQRDWKATNLELLMGTVVMSEQFNANLDREIAEHYPPDAFCRPLGKSWVIDPRMQQLGDRGAANYGPMQGKYAGGTHDDPHWDYSQLFCDCVGITARPIVPGADVDMRDVYLARFPALRRRIEAYTSPRKAPQPAEPANGTTNGPSSPRPEKTAPALPSGYSAMPDAAVTAEMGAWAQTILRDRAIPVFGTSTKTFGDRNVLARVEWHPPSASIASTHRGVSLYERHEKTAPTPAPSSGTATLGQRAVNVSLAELDAGVHGEPPGSHESARIDEYKQGRGGRGDNWCAWGFCYAAHASLRSGERLPHDYTGRVSELVRTGTFHPRGAAYSPHVGDGAVFKRNDQDPASGGQGHIGRVLSVPDAQGRYETIEANSIGDAWARRSHNVSDPNLSGWLEYPSTEAPSVSRAPAPAPPVPRAPAPPPAPAVAERVLLVGDSLGEGLAAPLVGIAVQRGGPQVASSVRRSTTIADWLSGGTLKSALAEQKPRLTLVSLGTNDLRGGNPAGAGRRGGELADVILGSGSAVAWILPPTMPFGDGGFRAALSEELERRGVRMFDSSTLTIPRASDGIHPTAAGYKTWADAIAAWVPFGGPRPTAPPAPSGAEPSPHVTLKERFFVQGMGELGLEEYVARVVAAEMGNSTEAQALAAQAIAARTYVQRALRDDKSLGSRVHPVPNSTTFQVAKTDPRPIDVEAARSTAGGVALHKGRYILANFVAGAQWPSGAWSGKGGRDPTGTEHYVTYNRDKRGASVSKAQPKLADPAHRDNRGVLSQQGADALARRGWLWPEILRYFYGDDIAFTHDEPTASFAPAAAAQAPAATSTGGEVLVVGAAALALLGSLGGRA